MSQQWRPECAADELLVAIVSLKRAFTGRSPGTDPGFFPVLHQLATSGPTRQGTLAEVLALDASTVSRHVRALVADGLVEPSRDPDDGRATVLTVTPAGRERLAQRLDMHRARLEAATASFTTGERAELVRLLNQLAAGLGDLEETP